MVGVGEGEEVESLNRSRTASCLAFFLSFVLL